MQNITTVLYAGGPTAAQLYYIWHLIKALKIEYIMLAVSFAFAVASFIILTNLRLPNTSKFFVHKQLLFSYIFMGVFTLLLHDDIRYRIAKNKNFCISMVIFYQYATTSFFACMFVEGVHMVVLLTSFSSSMCLLKRHVIYVMIGWGIPFISTCITLAIGFDYYKTTSTCYSLAVGGIWLWKGPITVILTANTILFIVISYIAVKKMCSKRIAKKKREKIWKSIRSVMVLTPLLGFTFLLGFFTNMDLYILYVYVVINNSLGCIFFLFHVLIDPQVRIAIWKDIFGIKEIITSTIKANKNEATPRNSLHMLEMGHHRRSHYSVTTMLTRNVIGVESRRFSLDSAMPSTLKLNTLRPQP